MAFSSRSKKESINKLEELRAFAEAWGEREENRVPHYPADPDKPNSYITVFENPVERNARITTRWSWSHLINQWR